MSGSLKARTTSGIAWSTIAHVGQQVTQLAVSILLARLLGPEAYGLIAMLTVFIGFAWMFAELGFGAALVQRPSLRPEQVASVFWLSIGVGALLGASFYMAAPWIAAYYLKPDLVPLARLLAISFIINGVAIVPRALLQKRMAFRRLAQAEITAAIGAGLVAIVLALAGFGVWSLVIQSLLGSALTASLVLSLARWTPRLEFSVAAVRELLGYSANLFGFNFVNYWARNADNLLIGRFFGSTDLGIYNRAYSLMLMPITQVVRVISRVMFPALASIQEDRERVRRLYLRAMSAISVVALPLIAGLFSVATPFVQALLGDEWLPVAPVLQILCGAGALQTMLNPVGWIYQSQGRTDWMFRWGVGASSVLVAAIIAGIRSGTIEAVAWWYLGANAVLVWPGIALPGRLVGIRVRDVVGAVSGSFGCSALMACLVLGLHRVLPATWAPGAVLGLEVVLGGVFYSGCVLLLRPRGVDEVLGIVTETRERRRLRVAPVQAGGG